MEGLLEPERLRGRIMLWVAEEHALGHLLTRAGDVLAAILYRGEFPRADVAGVGATDRHARRIVAALVQTGVVTSDGPRAPLRLAFPATLAPRLMPGSFRSGRGRGGLERGRGGPVGSATLRQPRGDGFAEVAG